jgi:hypothetical protein
MKFDKAFSYISRINQSAAFLFILSLILLLIFGLGSELLDSRKPKAGEIAVSEEKQGSADKKILSFSRFHRINGTDVMTADISERQASIGPYERASNEKVKNVIFISTKENKAHLLFPHSNYLILSSGTVTIGGRFGDNEGEAARAFIYQFIKADTNKDQELNEEDSQTMGLAYADGSGGVEILNGFDHLISSDAIDASTLSIIYQKGDKVISAQYSLKTLKPISSTIITDLLALNSHG